MARSTYIYTVHHTLPLGGTMLLGTFTVKHEMVSAVRFWIDGGHSINNVQILRNTDGILSVAVDITDQFNW